MIQDSDRPTYHYLPSEGLLHDPCAAAFWKGRYHLFYLYSSWAESGVPRRSDGDIYKDWAHISSAELFSTRVEMDVAAEVKEAIVEYHKEST